MTFWQFNGEKGSENDYFRSTFEYNTDFHVDYGRDNYGTKSGGGGKAGGQNLMYTKEQLAEMEAESKPKDDPLDGIPTFYEFTQSTTFHGVSYIFAGVFKFRKLMWFLCVVAAIGIFVMQVGQRTFDFFQYNTIVDVQLVYTDKVPFPAVTLCNQNNFRTSIAVDNDLYYFVDEMYSVHNVSSVDLSKYNIRDIDTLTFLRTAAHQLTDFIDSCTYKGEPCNITQDFVTTLTDLGVCYTFNSGRMTDPLEVSESGINFGLSLILNVEQYEYMRGPQNDAGIKIHLHDQEEFPLMKDLGFAVAPGSHTLVGVERSVITSMEPPYGKCNASNPVPMSNCQINCRTQMIVENCGCRDLYMKNLTDSAADLCDMERQFVCIREQTVEIMKRQSECDCKIKCERVEYKPSLSYAQLSKFNIDRMVLNDPERRAAVNAKFLRARELSQRVILDVAEEDRIRLHDIQSKLHTLWEDMKIVGPAFESDLAFANHYKILPMIESGDNLWRGEVITLTDRFGQLAKMYGPVITTEMMYIDKWLPAVVFNLLEINTDGSTPGIATKIGTCLAMGQISFPLPEYNGEVRQYFRDNAKRKKRSHVEEHPGLTNFYAVDAPEYEKVKTLADCNDYLSLKQDMAEALVEHRENLQADLDHINTIHTTFNNFFAFAYQNTSKSPTVMPKYAICKGILETWNATLIDRLDFVTSAMQTFVDVNSTADLMPALMALLTHAGSLAEDAAYTLRGKLYLNCYWIYFELMSEDDRGLDYLIFYRYNLDLNNAYLSYPTIRTSFNNLGEFGQGIYSILENTIVPSLSITDDYLNERVTKMDMAQVFDSLTLRRALGDLVAFAEDFISISREFDQRMKSVMYSIGSGYRFAMSLTLPLVDRGVLWDLYSIKYAIASGLPQYRAVLDRFHNDTEDWGEVYNDFVMTIANGYTTEVEALKVRLPHEIDELIKSVDIMTEHLVEYIEANDMNQAFFMENFVQVDVFYKGMVYEAIVVQQAFAFLSLLGEVGGFMGLLLGASTLTICEIIDFLILIIYKRMKLRMIVNPGKDDVSTLPV